MIHFIYCFFFFLSQGCRRSTFLQQAVKVRKKQEAQIECSENISWDDIFALQKLCPVGRFEVAEDSMLFSFLHLFLRIRRWHLSTLPAVVWIRAYPDQTLP